MNVLMTKADPQMLILGSSRASHHYDPELLRDSLGIEVLNAGFDGLGTAIGYGILAGISQRGYPKYILCDMNPLFDLYDENGSVKGLNDFYPYLDNPVVNDLLIDFDPATKWKIKSNAYRLNSSLVRLIPSILSKNKNFRSGFLPLHKTMKRDNSPEKADSLTKEYKISIIKEKYLRKLIYETKANGCTIIFAISPMYRGGDISNYKEELDILSQYDVPIFNHLNEPSIIYNEQYFQDAAHMNINGAEKYSKIIVRDLNHYFNIEKEEY